MSQIDIEAQHESVLQFVLSLPQDPQGTELRVNGKPLFRVLPVSPAAETWTNEMIARRLDLVEKEVRGSITPEEAIELENLQEGLRRYRRVVAPLPLAETRRMLEELERKGNG